MKGYLHNLYRQRGQGMSEYIIITALVAVAGIGVFASFGDTISEQISVMAEEMSGQDGNADDAQDYADTASDQADTADNLSNYTDQNKNGSGGG